MWASLFLALPFASALPAADSSPSLQSRADVKAAPYVVADACHSTHQYEKVIKSVRKAREMAEKAVKEWWDDGKHGEVAATYLAIPDDGEYTSNKWAQIAVENLRMVSHLTESNFLFSRWIGVGCEDQWNQCNTKVEGTNRPIAAYAKNWNSVDGRHYDVVVCEVWNNTDTPDQIYDTFKDLTRQDFGMDWLENDANKMLHEMMHINLITEPNPHIKDMLYQGKRVYGSKTVAEWVLDYKAKPEDVVKNADSYAQFVNAIYFKDKFGFLPAPTRPEPLEEDLSCYDGGDSYVDKNYASRHAEEFCEKLGSNFKRGERGSYDNQYAEDLPDHVEFKAEWSSKLTWSGDQLEDKCLDVLPKTIHDCDTDSRWKHGGVYEIKEGDENLVTLYFTPKHERLSPIPDDLQGKCNVWYKFLYNEFHIRGGLWAGDDYGQKQLLPKLRRCGAITKWSFEYDLDDPYEWKAYGRIPIGAQQWDCVHNAIKDAHGPSVKCGGS